MYLQAISSIFKFANYVQEFISKRPQLASDIMWKIFQVIHHILDLRKFHVRETIYYATQPSYALYRLLRHQTVTCFKLIFWRFQGV